MASTAEDIFTFLSLRPIRRLQGTGRTQGVIRDDAYGGAARTNGGGVVGGFLSETDIYSAGGPSAVGKSVFNSVRLARSLMATVQDLERVMLRPLPTPTGVAPAPVLLSLRLTPADAQRLSALSARPQLAVGNRIVVFPGGADDIGVPLTPSLSRLRTELEGLMAAFLRAGNPNWDQGPSSSSSVQDPVLHSLVTRVFSLADGGYTRDFHASKRILFDALYGLTVLRKVYPADPSPAIAGLQTLHAMERLAIALFSVHCARVGSDPTEMAPLELLAATLSNAWPELSFGTEDWATAGKRLELAEMPFALDVTGPARLLQAQPVIPPVFVRLRGAFQPFNTLRPVGIGDLMVVRQTFVGYRKGEIARIETVMSGEEKDRTLRRLDRTEDTQAFSFSEDSESSTESTTSERFELKREAETVLKMDVSAALSASVTYNGAPVVSTVTANASLAVGKSESEKLSESFARDVTERALSRVQRRASQTRTRTLVAETEDTAVHRLKAPAGSSHVNGFYRWVDKVYSAEVRNYGRRLMFELVVPEPAAFHVQSRLLAHVASLNLPKYPVKVPPSGDTNNAAIGGVTDASMVTPAKWEELNRTYYLDHLPPPPSTVEGVEIVRGSGSRTFSKSSNYYDGGFASDGFANCRFLDAPVNYLPRTIRLHGEALFRGKNETANNWQNEFAVDIGSTNVFSTVDEKNVYWTFGGAAQALPAGFSPGGLFDLTIRTKTADRFNVSLTADFEITPAAVDAWKQRVFAALVPARLRPTGTPGASLLSQDVEAYLAELKEVERPTVRRVIQGGSSAANRRRMEQEIKRLAISQFTREFDVQASDDQVSQFETMGEMPVGAFRYPSLSITPGDENAPATAATFDAPDRRITGYATADVGLSRLKGAHIQFIEHAFEWTQLSFVFYPYYWATPPKWIELLDREDDADPQFTDFLQAGAARVLIAVRPGFEDAVMHYLATREPWAGGSVPVIGDDLHLPVHEEIRELTEDRAGTGIAVGEPWLVTVPTSLVYLESGTHPLPDPAPPPVTPPPGPP